MEEVRIDLREVHEQRQKEAQRTAKLLHRLNQAEPFSEAYQELVKELFTGGVGEDCYIQIP